MPGLSQRMNRPVVAVLAVAAIAGVIRFAAIDDPRELVFDETYYAKSGCIQVTDARPKECRIDSGDERYWRDNEWDVGSWVHPPLGKLTIGLGIRAFSMSSFGWRFTSALAGIGVAVFSALMAQLLFGKPVWTFVAGLLIAVDGLNVVLSRIGAPRHPPGVLGVAGVPAAAARPALDRPTHRESPRAAAGSR